MTDVEEIGALVDRYRSWLKDKTKLRLVNRDWVEITTPFLDRHNDSIQIYARRDDQGFLLSDDGQTLSDLEISGCPINSPKRKELLKVALNGFGVEENRGVLSVKAGADNFALRKHSLIQAILSVNDLFFTSNPTVFSIFKEEVGRWLEVSEIRFLPDVQFVGKTGYVHHFDFAIPRSSRSPERILKAINNPNKDSAQSLIFSWMDTREERPPESTAWAILNDREKAISTSVMEAFRQYDIHPVLWTTRGEVAPRLAN
jgi:hypothetical protein